MFRWLDRWGWVIAIMFVCIGLGVCYSQYRAVHDTQERHFASSRQERVENHDLLLEIRTLLGSEVAGR